MKEHLTAESNGRMGPQGFTSFAKALNAKSAWNMVKGTGLWNHITHIKYIMPLLVTEWIQTPVKNTYRDSTFWRETVNSFDIIGSWLSWKIGNGRSVRIGQDPWVGGKEFVSFSDNMICHLDDRGYTHLHQIYILNVPPLSH